MKMSNWAVYRVVWRAVRDDVVGAVWRAVNEAVNRAVGRALDRAVFRTVRQEPEHPALWDFLGEA